MKRLLALSLAIILYGSVQLYNYHFYKHASNFVDINIELIKKKLKTYNSFDNKPKKHVHFADLTKA